MTKFNRYLSEKKLKIKNRSEIPKLRDLSITEMGYSDEKMAKALMYRLFDPSVVLVLTDGDQIYIGTRSFIRTKIFEYVNGKSDSSDNERSSQEPTNLDVPDIFLRVNRRMARHNIDLEELAGSLDKSKFADEIRIIRDKIISKIENYRT